MRDSNACFETAVWLNRALRWRKGEPLREKLRASRSVIES